MWTTMRWWHYDIATYGWRQDFCGALWKFTRVLIMMNLLRGFMSLPKIVWTRSFDEASWDSPEAIRHRWGSFDDNKVSTRLLEMVQTWCVFGRLQQSFSRQSDDTLARYVTSPLWLRVSARDNHQDQHPTHSIYLSLVWDQNPC